ncbi:ABC transporter substrate-binding protein [Acrocarpospora sp. B8E8]|uniref:ABC transporter substrate-binding protein n=1 Tax=Acrocarpospora sp. B8E8 TaxID=3153572 RepID=UPI00325CECD8
MNASKDMRPSQRRRRLLAGCLVLAALAVGCGNDGSNSGAGDGQKVVTVGVTGSLSDAPFLIAQAKGYFAQQGLKVEIKNFKSASDMIAPLGAGQLDVGAGSPSAGLYNAIASGVKVRMVADKSYAIPGNSYSALLVRKDLVDSGKFRSFSDLKGMTIAGYGEGGTPEVWFDRMLRQGGLTQQDITWSYMSGSDQVVALQNGSVDASTTTEPQVTQAVESGAAVRFAGSDSVYPKQEIGVVLYGGDFIDQRADAATAFMKGWIQGVRLYNDALEDARLKGPKGDEVISIMTKMTKNDEKTLRTAISQGIDSNGEMNIESLENDLAYYQERGYITKDVTVTQSVDDTFAKAAVQELGRVTNPLG